MGFIFLEIVIIVFREGSFFRLKSEGAGFGVGYR